MGAQFCRGHDDVCGRDRGYAVMKWKTFVIGYALVLALLLFGQRRTPASEPPPYTGVVDLTHALNDNTPAFRESRTPGFEVHTVATIAKDGYFARAFSVPEHFGTHLDAPAHFAPGRWTVEQIPPQRMIGPLVVLDVRGKAQNDADYQVALDDIAEWETANGHIPPGAIVVTRTGWSQRWSAPQSYRNADAKGVLHFPGYSLEAAKFLVEGRNAFGIGIDTLSVDCGKSKDFPVHHYTLAHSVFHLENLANLDGAPDVGALAIVAPLKLEGGSGAPVRVYALTK
jgi:kynurenine formamidase